MELPEVNSERWLSLKDLDGEVWKTIPNLGNHYAISNYGRLKSLSRAIRSSYHNRTTVFKERIVRLNKGKFGYLKFRPCVEGKLLNVAIHRLVAEAFIPNPNGYPVINHKDENPSNNIAANLEWCSVKYNSNYGTCQERRSATLRRNIRHRLPTIKQYDLKGNLVGTFVGRREIEDAGFNYRSVRNCCCHNVYTAQGYVWRENDDAFATPKRRENKGLPKKINCYDLNMRLIKTYDSMSMAARAVGGKTSAVNSILACCVGRYHTAYGYKWRYANGRDKA